MGLTVVMDKFGLLSSGWGYQLGDRLEWCHENCNCMVFHDVLAVEVRWQFAEEEDAMAYKLRWS